LRNDFYVFWIWRLSSRRPAHDLQEMQAPESISADNGLAIIDHKEAVNRRIDFQTRYFDARRQIP